MRNLALILVSALLVAVSATLIETIEQVYDLQKQVREQRELYIYWLGVAQRGEHQ